MGGSRSKLINDSSESEDDDFKPASKAASMNLEAKADTTSKVAGSDDFVRQSKGSVGATGNMDSDFTKQGSDEQRAIDHASEVYGVTDKPGLSHDWANVISYATEMLKNPL